MKTKLNFIKKIFKSEFFQTYKEEMLAVPMLLGGFWLFNRIFTLMFPNSAFFDYVSQIETIIFKIIVFIISVSTAHLALRLSFPSVYKFLNIEIYHNFNALPKITARKYAVAFILVFIIASAIIFA